jgi:hypothetical protein
MEMEVAAPLFNAITTCASSPDCSINQLLHHQQIAIQIYLSDGHQLALF